LSNKTREIGYCGLNYCVLRNFQWIYGALTLKVVWECFRSGLTQLSSSVHCFSIKRPYVYFNKITAGMIPAFLLTANFSEDIGMKYVYIAKNAAEGFGGV